MADPTSTLAAAPGAHATWCGHEGPVEDRVEGFSVVACRPCGFRHVVPLPTAEELAGIYRHEYYDREKPLYLERHRADLPWLELGHRERYELFEREGRSGGRRLLDVGSGPGFFLAHGRARGWRVLGVEPSQRAAAHARSLDLDVVEEFLTPELAARLDAFDVVHLNDVLEHVPDPAALVGTCVGLLRPGGLLCVAVPNDYNPVQRALRSRGRAPWWVAPPHHLNYFDFESLERLLARAGLEPVARDTSFPIDLFLLMGIDYVGDEEVGRRCHGWRMRLEQGLAEGGHDGLRRELYRRFAELGLGRHAVVTARRGPDAGGRGALGPSARDPGSGDEEPAP